MTLTVTDAVAQGELNVTANSPVALLFDVTVKLAAAALVIAFEEGVIVRLEVPAAVIVTALLTVTLKLALLPPFLLIVILPGLTLIVPHAPPPPETPPTGPASTALQSVTAKAAGAVVPLIV